MWPPLGDDHAHPGVARGPALHRRVQRARPPVLEAHPEPLMHQLVRQLAVVGDQERALDVVVEPAHRIDPLGDALQVLRDVRPALRIRQRRHAAGRLVEYEPDLLLRIGDELAVDADQVLAGIGLCPQLLHRLPVQLDAALGDELLRLAPRRHARVGEDLLQAFLHHCSGFPLASGGSRSADSSDAVLGVAFGPGVGLGPGVGIAFGSGGGASTWAAALLCSSATSMASSSCDRAASLSAVCWASFSAASGSWARSVRPATGGAGASSSTILRLSSESSWNSRSVGSCVRSRRLNSSRNSLVVPNSSGLPGSSFLPRMRMSLRSSSAFVTAPQSTPRRSSISGRVIGWRYATMASVSSAARVRRIGFTWSIRRT